MLLFAITGFTLNHAGQIEAKAQTVHRNAQLPAPLLHALAGDDERKGVALPNAVADWVAGTLDVDVAGRTGDWSTDEIYLSMPRPGGDAWLSIERDSGAVSYEVTDRGWIAYLNDLHKGRHAGKAWGWFIDLFAAVAIVFCLTGLLLLYLHANRRRATWPRGQARRGPE